MKVAVLIAALIAALVCALFAMTDPVEVRHVPTCVAGCAAAHFTNCER